MEIKTGTGMIWLISKENQCFINAAHIVEISISALNVIAFIDNQTSTVLQKGFDDEASAYDYVLRVLCATIDTEERASGLDGIIIDLDKI